MHSLNEFAGTLPVLLGGPIIYFLVGLPWAIATGRMAWAPLWGAGLLGFTAEIACMLGQSVPIAVMLVIGLHVVAALAEIVTGPATRKELGHELPRYARTYLIALVPLAAAPFALPGAWGGDWAMGVDSGLRIWHAVPFESVLLARPPLFGAAAIPAMLIGPPLAGYMVFCAVASACALQVFQTGLKPGADRRLVWILAGSIFFLQITANAWPKFLAAAFVVAAWQALASEGRGRLFVAGALLGFGLATHHSSLLFVPLLLTRCWGGKERWLQRAWAPLVMLGIAALLVGPWEAHTIVRYGWAAKIQANPAVGQRLTDIPAWLNAMLVGVTTFLAWGPLRILAHWATVPDSLAASRVAKELYWLVTSVWNSCAGCLFGLMLPWGLAIGFRDLGARLRALMVNLRRWEWLALTFALLLQMGLNPYYSAEGSLQTGWVPVGLAAAIWFANELAAMPAALQGSALGKTVWLGLGPWLLFNLALTLGLFRSAALQAQFADADLTLLAARSFTAFGLGCFPWLQVALGGFLFLFSKSPKTT